MNITQSYLTPIGYLVDLNAYGLVEGSKDQLRGMSLAEFILLSDNLTVSKNLNQVGEVKLELLSNVIKESKEYKLIKNIL